MRVQIIGVPATVTPRAPAGLQNAPGVTIRSGVVVGAVTLVVVVVGAAVVVVLAVEVLVLGALVVVRGGAVGLGLGAGRAQTSACNPLMVVTVGL